jgi:hypothetical protein
MRVTPEQELQSLDFSEVSAPAYSGDRPSINTPVFVSRPPSAAAATASALKPAPAGGK